MNHLNEEEHLGSQNMRVAMIRIIKGIGSLQEQLGNQSNAISRLEAAKAVQPTERPVETPKVQIPVKWLLLAMLGASITGALVSWLLMQLAPPGVLYRTNGRVNNLEIRMQRLENALKDK
ncbi:MAG: hypothetical protein WA919_07675 [Coleofasciculaceae cyanobacterium]